MLNLLGLHSGPLDVLDSQTAVFIGMVYAYLPIAVVPLFVVLDRIPEPLIEASRDLGASRWETFWLVTWPLSRPGHRDRRLADRRADAGRAGDPAAARRQPRRADGPGDLAAIPAVAELSAGFGDGGAGPDRRRHHRRHLAWITKGFQEVGR